MDGRFLRSRNACLGCVLGCEEVRTPSRITRTKARAAPRTECGKEDDTTRRQKRLSLPAVTSHANAEMTNSNVVGKSKSRRSLVLGKLRANGSESQSELMQGVAAGRLNEQLNG